MSRPGELSADPSLVRLDEVREAAGRIAGAVERTPLLPVQSRDGLPTRTWLKCENLQRTGSFKIRGATNAVAQLGADERSRGVVAHSSGNHGQALALAARTAGMPATVVMPHTSSMTKQAATRGYGAEVVLVDAAERLAAAERIRDRTGAALVPPFDDARVIAGQGTVGLEIAESLPDVEVVLVPVSGGGLISGIAVVLTALCPGAVVVGVEPELAGDLAAGFADGRHVAWDPADTGRTIADGLRVASVGDLPWRHVQALVDDVVTVTEQQIEDAVRDLALREHLVVEASGAVTYAAARRYASRWADRTTVCVLSGGNVDPDLLARVVVSGDDGGGSSS